MDDSPGRSPIHAIYAELARNPGYRVARIDPANKRGAWTIYDPQGQRLDYMSPEYVFLTKREGLAFLRSRDLGPEVTARLRAEREQHVQRKRIARLRAHPLHSDFRMLEGTSDAIAAEIKRLDRQIERTNHEPTVTALMEVQAHLRDAMLVAQTAAQARWLLITSDVDGESETN